MVVKDQVIWYVNDKILDKSKGVFLVEDEIVGDKILEKYNDLIFGRKR